ncbi:MAG: hypothetical protein WC301_07435 [Candidatus Omnitrophota bacterium]|jgi:hypothetical protein
MKEIDMGGFENQEILLTFAGKKYRIQADPPVELYRQFLSLQGMTLASEENWDKVKDFLAGLVAHSNDIDREAFKASLTKIALTNFMTQYNRILKGSIDDGKKKEDGQKKAGARQGK